MTAWPEGSLQLPGVLGVADRPPGGPAPWLNLRTIFNMLWARTAIYPSQSTFPNLRSRDRAQLNRSSEAKVPSAMVRRRNRYRWYSAVAFLSLAACPRIA